MVDGKPARMALLLVDSQNGLRYDHQIEPIDVIMVYWCNGVVEVYSTTVPSTIVHRKKSRFLL